MWIKIGSVCESGEEFLERYSFLKESFNIELRESKIRGYRGIVQTEAFIEIKTVDDLLKLSDVLHENKFDYDKLGEWCDFIIHSPDADGYSIEVYDGFKE
jgi:hypothetical protein